MKKTVITTLVLIMVLVGCSQTFMLTESPASPVSEAALRAHIEFLASDSLAGRDTGTVGYQVAAEYVAAEFLKLGMSPGGDNGSFFQQVPMVEIGRDKGSVTAVIHGTGGDKALKFPGQFLMGPDQVRAETSVTAELVFVGHGIVAPQFDHNDYAEVEAEGKIVVMLEGRPKDWPTEEGAHLGSGAEKRKHAAEAGAVGRIVLQTPRGAQYFPWEQNYPYLDVKSMNWVASDGKPNNYYANLQGVAYVNKDAAGVFFDGAAVALEEIYKADSGGEPVPTFDLAGSTTLSRRSVHRALSAPNVVGIIEGSDPQLKIEYVVYSAHLDHLGVIADDEVEDTIYNGALDNAAGVATLLETARILSLEKHKLKRSVMFLTVTGEEKGLLGAGYFAAHPTVPIDSLVANINLDMPVLTYPFADVIAFGAEHSTLKGIVKKAAGSAGIKLSPDPMPEQGLFTRSDHYRLVQKGIPAVYLVTGFESSDPERNGGEIFQHHLKHTYHKPNDDIKQDIDYAAGAKFTEININIGREVSNAATRPRWNEGDFFGELFGSE